MSKKTILQKVKLSSIVGLHPLNKEGLKRSKYKKFFPVLLLVLVTIAFCFVSYNQPIRASSDVEQELLTNVNKQLDKINFGSLDDIVLDLSGEQFNLFSGGNFGDKVAEILSGKFSSNYPNVFSAIVALFLGGVVNLLPTLVIIVAIAIVYSLTASLRSNNASKSVNDIVHFVCYGVIIVVILNASAQLITLTTDTIGSMKRQMDVVFPILLTLVTAMGGIVSAGVYQPAVVLLGEGIMQLFNFVLLPLFIITLVFSVVSNLSTTTKLNNFSSFFSSTFKWVVGVCFTVFFAFLTIQGITAGVHDGISIRATKLTVKSFVPIVGGPLSDGFDLILASSILIKNAVGVAGMLLLFSVVLLPVLKIVAFILGLKLVSAVIEPICDERIHKFITSVSKNFTMLVACILGAAFMYLLTLGLIITTANVL